MAGLQTILTDKSRRAPLIRLLRRTMRFKGLVALAFFGSLMVALFGFGSLASTIPYLNTILENEGSQAGLVEFAEFLGPMKSTFIDWVDRYIAPDKIQALIIFSVVMFVIILLKGIAKFSVDYTVGLITNSTVLDIQKELQYLVYMEPRTRFALHRTGVKETRYCSWIWIA